MTGRRKPDALDALRARVREMADADPDARAAWAAEAREEAARLEEAAARRPPDWPPFDAGPAFIKALEPTEIEPIFQVPESWRPAPERSPKPRKRRGGRRLVPIPAELRSELEQRFVHPGDKRWTQEAIAARLKIHRSKVRRAEKRLRPN